LDLLEFIVLLGTIISSSASLGYWLAGKISSLEAGVGRLEQDFSSLRQDLSSLRGMCILSGAQLGGLMRE